MALELFQEWFPRCDLGFDLAPGVDLSWWDLDRGIDHDDLRWARFCWIKLSEGRASEFGQEVHHHEMQLRRGIPCDGYHFARPSSGRSARAEADVYLRARAALAPMALAAPALDAEDEAASGDWSDWAMEWLDRVAAETGERPILYTYPHYAATHLRDPELARYDLWIAHYASNTGEPPSVSTAASFEKGPSLPTWSPAFVVWQYSSVSERWRTRHLDVNVADLRWLEQRLSPTTTSEHDMPSLVVYAAEPRLGFPGHCYDIDWMTADEHRADKAQCASSVVIRSAEPTQAAFKVTVVSGNGKVSRDFECPAVASLAVPVEGHGLVSVITPIECRVTGRELWSAT